MIDTKAFNPEVSPFPLSDYVGREIPECPIITYIGKINYYWKTKGLFELLEAVKEIKDDFLLLFVANGKGLNEFKELLKEKDFFNKSIFLDFVPPWKIPSIIQLSTCVVVPEREFPIQYHVPILPKEVMAVGKCLILSKELYNIQCYGNLIDGENVFLVDPKNISQFHDVIKHIVRNPDIALKVGQNGYENSKQIDNFDEYIDETIKIYANLIKKY